MTTKHSTSRRQFLKGSSASLTLAFVLPLNPRLAQAKSLKRPATLNAFLTLENNGKITYYNPFVEMGQGTYTSLPMLIAEEMDADIKDFSIEQAPVGKDYNYMYGRGLRFTGGSSSVRTSYDIMRQAGAATRSMLLEAASKILKVSVTELSTEPGVVVHKKTGKRIAYGKLAHHAAKLTPPNNPKLKDPANFRYIGKPVKRTDTRVKTNGTAEFGIDIKVPGMLYATVKKSPVFGTGVESFDAKAVLDMAGVVAVERVPQGVAVVADSFWHAKKALDQLPITFEEPKSSPISSKQLAQDMRARLDEAGINAEDKGDIKQAFKTSTNQLEAIYEVPFLAHNTMEPMNCTAHVTDTKCELWAPNQGVDRFAETAAKITGIPLEKIIIHTPYLGGGFGRRGIPDYAEQALILSKRLGKPVKLIWTREEDTQQDFYRPMTLIKHRAAINKSAKVTAWHSTCAGEGPGGRFFGVKPDQVDNSVVEGATKQPYAIANKRVDYIWHQHPIPIGYWRSVGHSYNGFVTESFIDEMAHAVGTDPVAFRRELLAEAPRFLNLLNRVTEMADYKADVIRDADAPYAFGFAIHESFGSIVAQVAKVSIANNQPKVHKVWCAVDCGTMVNPDTIEAQMQSGISTGLSQALVEELTIDGGKAVEANFHDYPILRPHMMPEVEVSIIESGAKIGGIGEPGTPPIAGAVANAVFKLTGTRVRRLPMKHYKLELAAS